MILNYSEIKDIIDLLGNKVFELGPPQIQKIYSTIYHVCLQVRFKGQTLFLYLGRGKEAQGVALGERKPPLELKSNDAFFELLKSRLKNRYLSKIEVDEQDRIIKIEAVSKDKVFSWLFFWKGVQFYFAYYQGGREDNYWNYICSWGPRVVVDRTGNHFSIFDDVGRKELKERGQTKKLETSKRSIDEWNDKSLQKSPPQKLIKRKRKFLERKKNRILADLEKVSQWSKIQELLIEEKLDLMSANEVQIEKNKFKFGKNETLYKRRDKIFNKLKNFKMAEKILNERLERIKSEIVHFNAEDFSLLGRKPNRPVWVKPKLNESVLKLKNVRRYICTRSGIEGYVGLNSSGNDYIRSQLAQKNDLWLHLKDLSSSHVCVKIKDIDLLGPEDRENIVSMMSDLSGHKADEINIVYSLFKDLRGVNNSKGSVTIKRPRYLKLMYNKDWKKGIEFHG